MDIYLFNNPRINKGITKVVKYTIQPGITMLIGSNGSGKTTTLSQIHSTFSNEWGIQKWEEISKNETIKDLYASFHYDNVYEERWAKDRWMHSGLESRFASTFENSEGQDMYDFLYYKIEEIGKAVTKAINDSKKGIFILLDGLDSGLSLDVINKIRKDVLEFIIETEKKRSNLEVYIVCSANSYEFCNNYDCIDVTNQEHITFTNYEDYSKYFIKEDV